MWHHHIDTIWAGAPDLFVYGQTIMYPFKETELLDPKLSAEIIQAYAIHVLPKIKEYEESSEFIIHSILEFWVDQLTPELNEIIEFVPELELVQQRGRIILRNKEQLEAFIESNDRFIEPFQALLAKIESSNRELPDEVLYDIVVFVNTHGSTTLSAVDPAQKCADDTFEIGPDGKVVTTSGNIPILTPPRNKQVTFLTAKQIGIDNIKHDELREVQSYITHVIKTTGTLNIVDLQKWFQKRKHERYYRISEKKAKIFEAKFGKEAFQEENHYKGWTITQERYADRIYVPDPNWNPKIAILGVKRDTELTADTPDLFERVMGFNRRSSMTTKSEHLRPHIYRSELLNFLYTYGYTHPLVIDSSCGGLYTLTPPNARSRRYTKNSAVGVAGGTRKKKCKREKSPTKWNLILTSSASALGS